MISCFAVTVTILMFQLSLILAPRSSFKLALCPGTFPSFFKQFLAFWQNNLFWAHFLLFLPQPFLQGALVPFSGKLYLLQKVALGCQECSRLWRHCCSTQTAGRLMRTFPLTFIDYSLGVEVHNCTPIAPILILHHRIHSSFLSVFVPPFSDNEKPGSHGL